MESSHSSVVRTTGVQIAVLQSLCRAVDLDSFHLTRAFFTSRHATVVEFGSCVHLAQKVKAGEYWLGELSIPYQAVERRTSLPIRFRSNGTESLGHVEAKYSARYKYTWLIQCLSQWLRRDRLAIALFLVFTFGVSGQVHRVDPTAGNIPDTSCWLKLKTGSEYSFVPETIVVRQVAFCVDVPLAVPCGCECRCGRQRNAEYIHTVSGYCFFHRFGMLASETRTVANLLPVNNLVGNQSSGDVTVVGDVDRKSIRAGIGLVNSNGKVGALLCNVLKVNLFQCFFCGPCIISRSAESRESSVKQIPLNSKRFPLKGIVALASGFLLLRVSLRHLDNHSKRGSLPSLPLEGLFIASGLLAGVGVFLFLADI